MRGIAGTQEAGLPLEHARKLGGGALCGARRRQGVLLAERPTCRRCRRLLEAERRADLEREVVEAAVAWHELGMPAADVEEDTAARADACDRLEAALEALRAWRAEEGPA